MAARVAGVGIAEAGAILVADMAAGVAGAGVEDGAATVDVAATMREIMVAGGMAVLRIRTTIGVTVILTTAHRSWITLHRAIPPGAIPRCIRARS